MLPAKFHQNVTLGVGGKSGKEYFSKDHNSTENPSTGTALVRRKLDLILMLPAKFHQNVTLGVGGEERTRIFFKGP